MSIRKQAEIMKNWGMKTKPLVSIGCITYNHEDYVEEAIQSFLMQETNFPFEIIIHDDASTDNTAKIIAKYFEAYPKIIKPIFQKENQYSKTNVLIYPKFVYPNCKGKYIALCEGDDYWTDPLKLQKQVALMEKHPECSLIFHAYTLIDSAGRAVKTNRAFNKNTIFPQEKIINISTRNSHTSTLLIKNDCVKYLPKWVEESPTGDIPLKLLVLLQGRAAYINASMSAYRINTLNSYTRRVKNNPNVFVNIKRRRSKMWEEFNEFSRGKYKNEVIKQILISNMQTQINKSLFSRIKFFLSKKNTKLIKKLTFKNKVKVFVICLVLIFDPNLRQRKYFYNNPLKKYFYKI